MWIKTQLLTVQYKSTQTYLVQPWLQINIRVIINQFLVCFIKLQEETIMRGLRVLSSKFFFGYSNSALVSQSCIWHNQGRFYLKMRNQLVRVSLTTSKSYQWGIQQQELEGSPCPSCMNRYSSSRNIEYIHLSAIILKNF